MGDRNYTFVGIPKVPGASTCRSAILHPLALRSDRKTGVNADDIVAAADRLLKQWRARLWSLMNHNWSKIASDPRAYVYSRNCWPTMVQLEPVGVARMCKMSEICPWCYARKLMKIHKVVKEHRTTMQLVGSVYTRFMSGFETSVDEIKGRFLSTLQAIVRANRPLLGDGGITWALTIEPALEERYDGMWKVSSRILAVLPRETRFELLPDRWKRERYLRTPTSKEMSKCISRVFRYPCGLMHGETEKVVQALEARRKQRWSENFGCFRNIETKGEKVAKNCDRS